MRRIKSIHAAVILTMMVGWACADTVEVTLTGVVTWTFPGSQIEAWGIQAGDSFTRRVIPNYYDKETMLRLRIPGHTSSGKRPGFRWKYGLEPLSKV